jgi:hypothetical protein
MFTNNLAHIVLKKDFMFEDAGIRDRTHFRYFTKKSMIRMFEECGFEVTNIKGINPNNGWKYKMLNLLSFGYFEETRYLQYILSAKLKS